jgi:hypothetical protein
MAEISPGLALRQLEQTQAGLRKAREALRVARSAGRESPVRQHALALGWESLARTYRVLSGIPLSAATDDVLTRQLAVSRYATALLVRLRRLVRNESAQTGEDADPFDDDAVEPD